MDLSEGLDISEGMDLSKFSSYSSTGHNSSGSGPICLFIFTFTIVARDFRSNKLLRLWTVLLCREAS